MSAVETGEHVDFLAGVRRLIAATLRRVAPVLGAQDVLIPLMPGKMLRSKLAARLSAVRGHSDALALQRVCTATELAHTASLCHDDVIDSALVRRACPTLWRKTSASAAVLIGDLLLCEAVGLLLDTADGAHVKAFASKLREVCAAETEQEIRLRGQTLDTPTCLRLARQKTGPLFAFVACACAEEDAALRVALEEAGYRIGTAYQLADDLIDCMGREEAAGKTLGRDRKRRKYTLAASSHHALSVLEDHIVDLCSSALCCADEWPPVRAALGRYITLDIEPVLERHSLRLPVLRTHL